MLLQKLKPLLPPAEDPLPSQEQLEAERLERERKLEAERLDADRRSLEADRKKLEEEKKREAEKKLEEEKKREAEKLGPVTVPKLGGDRVRIAPGELDKKLAELRGVLDKALRAGGVIEIQWERRHD